VQCDYSAVQDDKLLEQPVNLCSHHPDQQNTTLKNRCLLSCFLDFLLSCSLWDFSLCTQLYMHEKEKGRARETCTDTHTSNNKIGFRKNCQLRPATPAGQQQLEEHWRKNIITAKGCPLISVVTSPPCRGTRFSFEVITSLHKYTFIYLLAPCLLGMPLGHTRAEKRAEDTTVTALAVQSVSRRHGLSAEQNTQTSSTPRKKHPCPTHKRQAGSARATAECCAF